MRGMGWVSGHFPLSRPERYAVCEIWSLDSTLTPSQHAIVHRSGQISQEKYLFTGLTWHMKARVQPTLTVGVGEPSTKIVITSRGGVAKAAPLNRTLTELSLSAREPWLSNYS